MKGSETKAKCLGTANPYLALSGNFPLHPSLADLYVKYVQYRLGGTPEVQAEGVQYTLRDAEQRVSFSL